MKFKTKPQKNNTSGVLGVSVLQPDSKNGPRFSVLWIDKDKKRKQKTFAWSKGGKEAALKKAVECRASIVKKYGRVKKWMG